MIQLYRVTFGSFSIFLSENIRNGNTTFLYDVADHVPPHGGLRLDRGVLPLRMFFALFCTIWGVRLK